MTDIAERHTYSTDYADVAVQVWNDGTVDIEFAFPEAFKTFVLSAAELSDLIAFVEKHTDVNVQPDCFVDVS